MKKLAVILTLFICSKIYSQQNEHIIQGIVQDKTSKQPVEFATVQLLQLPDSSMIKSTVTDRKGKFILEGIVTGNYVLQCSFIGYGKTLMPLTVDQKKENTGIIEISVLTKEMNEVTVTSRRSLLNASIDRKIYDVTQDIASQTGSASDILKNIPSVEVDIEGQVSLRGSGDVLILINGRPSPLMGKTRAEVLQQIPANTIQRIEIITNPSASFKPEGTSGIINIVLKKNSKTGWNGTVLGNAGNKDRYNGGINFNFKPGKLNIFSSYNIRQDSRVRKNNIEREYLSRDSNYTEANISKSGPVSHLVRFGVDYSVSDRNQVGISGSYYQNKLTRNDLSQRSYYDKSGSLISRFDRQRYDPESEKEKEATIYWQHNFPAEDHELRFEANFSGSTDQENNRYTTFYHFPSKPSSFDNTIIKEKDDQQQVTLDYSKPLGEDAKIEAGYDGFFNQLDLDYYGEYYDDVQQQFLKDIQRSNRFKYSEAIHGIYFTYERGFEKFGYVAGVRGEQVLIDGYLVTKDSSINNRYFKVYPTLHLSYKLKNGELQLNYSKRINRPDGDELNPFPQYRDPYNLRAGNPKLLPEIIHSFELGYKWQKTNFSFVPSLYYRYKKNGFTSVTILMNDSVLLTTDQNLSSDQSAGLELILSAKPAKFLSASLNANFFYNQIDASELGYAKNKSIISTNTNLNFTATITKTTMMQVNNSYRSARLTPQGKVVGSFVMNTGLRQDIFKKKVSLVLTISDIFNTQKQKTRFETPDLKQLSTSRRDSRVIYLGISYRFGKLIKKTGEEKMEFDDSL